MIQSKLYFPISSRRPAWFQIKNTRFDCVSVEVRGVNIIDRALPKYVATIK